MVDPYRLKFRHRVTSVVVAGALGIAPMSASVVSAQTAQTKEDEAKKREQEHKPQPGVPRPADAPKGAAPGTQPPHKSEPQPQRQTAPVPRVVPPAQPPVKAVITPPVAPGNAPAKAVAVPPAGADGAHGQPGQHAQPGQRDTPRGGQTSAPADKQAAPADSPTKPGAGSPPKPAAASVPSGTARPGARPLSPGVQSPTDQTKQAAPAGSPGGGAPVPVAPAAGAQPPNPAAAASAQKPGVTNSQAAPLGAPLGAAGGAPGGASGQAQPLTPARGAGTPPPGPQNLDQVRQGRVQSTNASGQNLITEPGNRTIVKQDNRVFITRNETTVIQNFVPSAQTTAKPGGVMETSYQRTDGARVFSEVDANGRLLRRYRREPAGREVVLVDNRNFYRNVAIGAGIGLAIGAVALAIAQPVVALPRAKYIVDYERASDDDLYEALTAPPVERLERHYSLEEIRYSEPLRAYVRRIDLDAITFEFGSFEVTPEQYPRLEKVARVIGRALNRNPAEVFMIEGHTDAVGSVEDNLSLSDRRAESVAHILAQQFNIPIENLVTQGYGEQFLKVQTQAAERLNRRVAVRRITPLLNQDANN